MSLAQQFYSTAIKRDDNAARKLPEQASRDLPTNALRQVGALTLQSTGDKLVGAATVLPWLFHALGVPAALTAFLVPIRESGSMLPQVLLTPWVLRVRHRKWVFVAGAAVQAASVAVMTAAAALADGLTAGLIIIAALAVFSLGRCLCSIASKDVQGRTIPKGERGQINGLATTASGIVAITVGLALRVFGGQDISAGAIALLLAVGCLLWVGVALIYASVREPATDPETKQSDKPGNKPTADESADQSAGAWFRSMVRLLKDDRVFRHFVLVRSFLLVSALSPPLVITLSLESGSSVLAGLGGYIIAAGLAAMIGGRIFGRWADRSSSQLMTVGAGAASLVLVALVVATWIGLPGGWGTGAVFVLVYFLLTLIHTGVRVGRKTYVVDIATGDTRTTYVAVSNSAMGLILLVTGAVISGLSVFGVTWALLFLAGLGILGAVGGARLPDVKR